jgi:hypothetical protein
MRLRRWYEMSLTSWSRYVTLENPEPELVVILATVTTCGKSTPGRGERSTVLLKGCRSGEGACLVMKVGRGWSVSFLHDDVSCVYVRRGV